MIFVKRTISIVLLTIALIVSALGCGDKKGEHMVYEKEFFENAITIDYTLSEYAEDKAIYVDKIHQLEIDPEKSALVIIDLWQEKIFDSLTVRYINPLINEFNNLGMKIIYAPSTKPQNKNLSIVKDGIYFYDYDLMDKYLIENQIDNLFYTGADTFYCVLDKPNGIFSFGSRNNSVRQFLLEDGVTSATKEMKQAALELLKKNGVGIVSSNKTIPDFPYEMKTSTDVKAKTKKEIRKRNNFILIFKGKEKNKALEHFEHELNINRIPHAVIKNNRMLHQGNEISPNGFIKLLRDHQIYNLYFSGFHLNNEMLWGDFGLTSLYIKIRYNGVKGLPWPYFITDLSFIAPSENMDPQLEKATIINHYRMAYNIESKTILEGIEKAKAATPTEAVVQKK